MICVARKARRVSSKLWHGRKDDEYLGFWDTFLPSAFWASAARKPEESFDKRLREIQVLFQRGPAQPWGA